jgi:hypothetical protein
MLTENQNFFKNIKKEIYNVMAVPIILYGSESWTVNIIKDWMTIQAAEMKFYRFTDL